MTRLGAQFSQKRLIRAAIGLVLVGSALFWGLFGPWQSVAFLSGGVFAGINLIWLHSSVSGIFFADPKASKRRILAGYLFRLLLIPLGLYAMIRFLFFSPLAVVGGFAACNCSILIEGILEALADRS